MKKRLKKLINRWLADRYGSSRGFILTYKHMLLSFTGRYKKYKKINWNQIDRLVFVCKGNICRSAFAEIVARAKKIEAISCGIDTDDGKPPNQNAVLIAAEKGFNLREHKTRKINSLGFRKGDLFIAMEPYQVKYLEDVLGNEYAYTLMGLWSKPIIPYIHDPYGSTKPYFKRCFDHIEGSVRAIEQKINESGI